PEDAYRLTPVDESHTGCLFRVLEQAERLAEREHARGDSRPLPCVGREQVRIGFLVLRPESAQRVRRLPGDGQPDERRAMSRILVEPLLELPPHFRGPIAIERAEPFGGLLLDLFGPALEALPSDSPDCHVKTPLRGISIRRRARLPMARDASHRNGVRYRTLAPLNA